MQTEATLRDKRYFLANMSQEIHSPMNAVIGVSPLYLDTELQLRSRDNIEKDAAMEMKLEVSDAALAEIANAGFDPVYGARPLKRAIQAQLENPLAKLILEDKFAPKDTTRWIARAG